MTSSINTDVFIHTGESETAILEIPMAFSLINLISCVYIVQYLNAYEFKTSLKSSTNGNASLICASLVFIMKILHVYGNTSFI